MKHLISVLVLLAGLCIAQTAMAQDTAEDIGLANAVVVSLYAAGRYRYAVSLALETLTKAEKALGEEHPSTLISVNNLAALYQAQGRYGEAGPLYRRALEASERVLGEEHPDTIVTQGNLASLLVARGDLQAALRELRQLDQRLYVWLGTEVRNTRAAAMQRQALRLNSVYQNAAFSLALAHPSEAASTFAANLALRWKKRIAQDDAILNNIARETIDPALLGAVVAVKAGRAELSRIAFDTAVPAEEKTRLVEALEIAEAELKARSSTYSRYQRVSAASADTVQFALPRGSALVEYRVFRPFDHEAGRFTGESHLLAIVITSDAVPVLVDLGEMGIFTYAQQLMTDADLRKENDIPFAALARFGHDRLIAPLLAHIGEARTLFIAPDGPLHAIPFEALADAEGTPLLEHLHVRMVQTGRDLVTRDRPAYGTGLVVVGGVDFGPVPTPRKDSTADLAVATAEERALDITRAQFEGFKYLPASLEEADKVAHKYRLFRPDEPTVPLTGANATEAALKSLASPPRVLHLATHGYYLETGSIDGRPLLQSGITLAGANRALAGEVDADGENGILHAVEAQTLNLYGTELVILSACDTGKGASDYSEGLEGLPRALYVAGAQNVIVALWPVGDIAARNFMDAFYSNWLSQKQSDLPTALRKTKRAFLDTGDPNNWAPFVLFEG